MVIIPATVFSISLENFFFFFFLCFLNFSFVKCSLIFSLFLMHIYIYFKCKFQNFSIKVCFPFYFFFFFFKWHNSDLFRNIIHQNSSVQWLLLYVIVHKAVIVVYWRIIMYGIPDTFEYLIIFYLKFSHFSHIILKIAKHVKWTLDRSVENKKKTISLYYFIVWQYFWGKAEFVNIYY